MPMTRKSSNSTTPENGGAFKEEEKKNFAVSHTKLRNQGKSSKINFQFIVYRLN